MPTVSLLILLIGGPWVDIPSCDQWTERDVEQCSLWCKPLDMQHKCLDGRCLCCRDEDCWEVIPLEPGC